MSKLPKMADMLLDEGAKRARLFMWDKETYSIKKEPFVLYSLP